MDRLDKLIMITSCDDGLCCCLPPRSAIALISLLSLVACLADMLSYDYECSEACCTMKESVEGMRLVLTTLFQVANVLLLLASITEVPFLVHIYVSYTLGFVVMGLIVAILELLLRFTHEGAAGLINFLPEVVFLFVISRCLPLVDTYRKHLDGISSIPK